MKMICLGSGSSGNCYLLKASKETLVLEAGLTLSEIKKGLDYSISGVVGVLISHIHKDHSLSASDLAKIGIPVFALENVFFGLPGSHFYHTIEPMHGFKVGGFKIFPFPVSHDVPCVGFVITHDEMGKLLFATDTMMIEYKFQGLNHIMIEANYDDRILDYNIEQGYVSPAMKKRLLGSHMELQTTKGILEANDLGKVSEIILIHLSSNNSNGPEFKAEAERATGIPTYIAHKGLEIELAN